MKYLKSLLLILLLLIILPTLTKAQLFQIGAGSGITQILAPSYYTDPTGDGGFGFSTEWNAGVIAKLGLPLFPLTPRAYYLYHSLTGSGEFKQPQNYQDPDVEYTRSISELGVGVEYNFIPLPAGFDPYIALDIAYNSFSSLEVNGNEVPYTKVNRFGGGIGLGTEITIIPIINVDVYASYKMFNLIGKESVEENITAFTFDVFILFSFL